MLPICARLPWSGDIGQHASTIWRLRENLAHPTSPMVDLPGNGSPYFSPYQVFGALVSRATGLVPLKTLHLLAVMNVLLVLAGIGAFTRALTTRRWAPVLVLACYFFLWGTDVRVWSGFESFISFSLGVSFPSAFAAGLMLLVWAAALRLLGRVPGTRPLNLSPLLRVCAHLALGAVFFVVLLSHPFTGIVMALGLLGILAGSLRAFTLRDWLFWVLSGAVVLAGAAVWPYWSLFSLQQSAALDTMHRHLYMQPLNWFGFAVLLGVPALVMRFRRDRLDPLVMTFLLVGATVFYGWASGHYSWGRAYPGALMMLQFAVALELVRVPRSQWFRRELSLIATGVLLVGVWVQSGAAFYIVPKSQWPKAVVKNVQAWDTWAGFQWTDAYLKYGDVVMTKGTRPLSMLAAYGYFTVEAGYPDPAIPLGVLEERGADTNAFFAEGTTEAEQVRLMEKYHATWVLISPADGEVPTGSAFQEVARSPQGEVLLKLVHA
ncbi:hypothetical protein [Kitasatospora paranensis]